MSEAHDQTSPANNENTLAAAAEAAARVAHDELARFLGDTLTAAGCDEASCDAAVRALVGASLRGVDSHGVRLLPHYVKVLMGGRVKGRPQMRFEKRAAAVGASSPRGTT